LVRRKVDEGHYSTEDEVVADALRLMQARDDVAEIKRARLRDAIERGYEDAAAGKVPPRSFGWASPSGLPTCSTPGRLTAL